MGFLIPGLKEIGTAPSNSQQFFLYEDADFHSKALKRFDNSSPNEIQLKWILVHFQLESDDRIDENIILKCFKDLPKASILAFY